MGKQKMFVYLISHDRKDIKTHTYIGASGNFQKRLLQHNCEAPGGPRITRRAAGRWSPVMILELPGEREYSAKDVKNKWKQSSRGLESRIRKGFELAQQYDVNVYISKEDKLKVVQELEWDEDGTLQLGEKEWNKLMYGD